MLGTGWIVRIKRIDGFHEFGAKLVSQDGFDLFVDLIADGLIVLHVLDHEFPNNSDSHSFQRLLADVFVCENKAGVRLLRDHRFRNGRKYIFGFEALDRVQYHCRVCDGAAMNTGAVTGVFVAGSAVHGDSFGREQVDDVVPRCRSFAGSGRLFADGARRQVRGNETPDPLLVPRGTRVVSYGLHAWPPHAAS
jgi:hypothetical protein